MSFLPLADRFEHLIQSRLHLSLNNLRLLPLECKCSALCKPLGVCSESWSDTPHLFLFGIFDLDMHGCAPAKQSFLQWASVKTCSLDPLRLFHPKMSPLRIVGLLALVAMIGAVSCANDNSCTPSTCGAGPVIISFSSTDCSGSGTFTNFANDDPSTFGSCVRDGSNDFYRIEVTNDFVAYTEVNNPSCDVTLANATYYVELYYFGKCRPRNNMARGAKDMNAATSSWMVLPNVNATYTSPQPAPVVNMNYPNIYVDIYSAPCVSTTNCTAENGQDPTFIAYNTKKF